MGQSITSILRNIEKKFFRISEGKDTPLELPGNKGSIGWKSLQLQLMVRFALVCIGGYVATLLFTTQFFLSGVWVLLIAIIIFRGALKMVHRHQSRLLSFLQSLQQGDFSVVFTEDNRAFDYEMNKAFNQLNRTFQSLRADRESQYQLLRLIVEHAAVPLICYEEINGEVYLTNNATKSLLNIFNLKRIDWLASLQPGLLKSIKAVRDYEKLSCKISVEGKIINLSITSKYMVFNEKGLKLVALNDVSSELAAKESETWRRMLNVLTHEIANSAIPLSMLSAHLNDTLTIVETEDRKPDADEWSDIQLALKTIEERSKSLKLFVNNFKNVNQIPEPDLKRIPVQDLISQTATLFAQDFKDNEVNFINRDFDGSLSILADRTLTMQVLINLTKNAIESMKSVGGSKRIEVSAEREGNNFIQIKLTDNGAGIGAENIEKIFIPFYTTKKGGSGIGLSISKQIMEKQKGDIFVSSYPGAGSTFALRFISG